VKGRTRGREEGRSTRIGVGSGAGGGDLADGGDFALS
jgi:hypothetical protein